MECIFCESEIGKIEKHGWSLGVNQKDKITGENETYPPKYECPKCIHVWLTENCAEDFPHSTGFQEQLRKKEVGEAIRQLCEKNDDRRLKKPLSIDDLIRLHRQFLYDR